MLNLVNAQTSAIMIARAQLSSVREKTSPMLCMPSVSITRLTSANFTAFHRIGIEWFKTGSFSLICVLAQDTLTVPRPLSTQECKQILAGKLNVTKTGFFLGGGGGIPVMVLHVRISLVQLS